MELIQQLKNILTPGENLELQTYVKENKIPDIKLALEQFINTRNWSIKAGRIEAEGLEQKIHQDQIACNTEKARLRDLFGQVAISTDLGNDVDALRFETEAAECNQKIISLERNYVWKDTKTSIIAQNAKLEVEIATLHSVLCQFMAENPAEIPSSREAEEASVEISCRR